MSHKSRRRLTLAAGAIVAGAAIPIAAAGIAWADDSLTSLVAVGDSQPMELSFDGQVLVDTCGNACTAISGTDNDLAIAYGDGSYAEADGGQGDKATASDGGYADASDGNNDTANADGYDTYAAAGDGNGDSATADGACIEAIAGEGNNDTASVTGYDSFAGAEVGNNDSATVTDGFQTYAYAGGSTEESAGGGSAAAEVSTGGANTGNYDTALANGYDSTAVAGEGYSHDYASASDGYGAYADYANHLSITEPPPLDPAAVVDPVGVIDPAAVVDPGAVDPAVFASLIP